MEKYTSKEPGKLGSFQIGSQQCQLQVLNKPSFSRHIETPPLTLSFHIFGFISRLYSLLLTYCSIRMLQCFNLVFNVSLFLHNLSGYSEALILYIALKITFSFPLQKLLKLTLELYYIYKLILEDLISGVPIPFLFLQN